MDSYARIATLVSELKAGIVSFIHYIPQDEQSYKTIVSCKWAFKGCLHMRFCAERLTSWSMCLTDESVEDKLQRIISGYLDA